MNIIIKETKNKDKGVFANKNFKKGEFIFGYDKGKIVTRKDFKKLTEWELVHLDELGDNKFEVMMPPACYVNHSCEPNAIQKGRKYFALKPIRKKNEITTDYRAKGIFKNKWRCNCASKICNGYVISDFFALPELSQKLYLPYTLKSIQKEYRKIHSKKKVKVLCGGKFNIVHKGHIYFLEKAKEIGDTLIVIIANDAHNKREYAQPQTRRKKIIENLEIADKVLIGNEKSFVKTVMKVKPDVITLGYDQKLPKDCIEYVKKNKIVIKRIGKFGNYKTSKILRKKTFKN